MNNFNIHDETYHELLRKILQEGSVKKDRTNTGTISIFGHQARYDLDKGFPLITTKKIHFKSIVHELLWFLRGDNNIKYLKDNGVSIWDEWADKDGNLGPVYGVQWRSWKGANGETIDQISKVIDQIKNNPDSRRLIVNAWNVADVEKMALPPCHMFFQFYTKEIEINGQIRRQLSCQMYQRSADVFLGVPFNIASYSLLIHMICGVLDMIPGEFVHTIGDAHIYSNHLDQVKEQLSRSSFVAPEIGFLRKSESVFDFNYEDIQLIGYNSHSKISAKVAV